MGMHGAQSQPTPFPPSHSALRHQTGQIPEAFTEAHRPHRGSTGQSRITDSCWRFRCLRTRAGGKRRFWLRAPGARGVFFFVLKFCFGGGAPEFCARVVPACAEGVLLCAHLQPQICAVRMTRAHSVLGWEHDLRGAHLGPIWLFVWWSELKICDDSAVRAVFSYLS